MILLNTVNSRVGTKNHTRRHSLLILCVTLIKVFEAFARQQQNVSKRLSICLCQDFCPHKNSFPQCEPTLFCTKHFKR